ncbi:MAG TPA: WYL domain-containing protein [Ktedonobacteraceae bacterium]
MKIRLTCAQAKLLQQDWYYRYAHFAPIAQDQMLVTFREPNPTIVLELLRWLGPGAELLEPQAWREMVREIVEKQALCSTTSFFFTYLP